MTGSFPLAYPLAWPENVARTEVRKSHGPAMSISSAVASLKDILALWAAENASRLSDVVISSNVTLGEAMPADPGVVLYFKIDGNPSHLLCDRFLRPEQNVRGIYEQIEARRAASNRRYQDSSA